VQRAPLHALPSELVGDCPRPRVLALLPQSLLEVHLDLQDDLVRVIWVVLGEILNVVRCLNLLP
jgi:hypothetical protein